MQLINLLKTNSKSRIIQINPKLKILNIFARHCDMAGKQCRAVEFGEAGFNIKININESNFLRGEIFYA